MVVHPHSHGDSSCPAVLRIQLALLCFHLRGSHTLRRAFPCPLVNSADTCRCPYPVNIATYGLASSIFARHYSRNLVWFLFLALLRCFSSGGSLPMTILFTIGWPFKQRPGCPIRKSPDITPAYGSPRLIAVNHVLHRLSVPRHSPCALYSLTFFTHLSQMSYVIL